MPLQSREEELGSATVIEAVSDNLACISENRKIDSQRSYPIRQLVCG